MGIDLAGMVKPSVHSRQRGGPDRPAEAMPAHAEASAAGSRKGSSLSRLAVDTHI